MTRKRSPYKTCTKAFKAEAMRLMQAPHRSASEIAKRSYDDNKKVAIAGIDHLR